MNGERESGQSLIIQETVSTRAIDALMSNYRDPQQAFLELIDNAVDNRIEGSQLVVRIRVTRDELSVYNQGGNGLDFPGLQKFFVWGYSEKTAREIGFYGVGGKAAMGYLGRSMEVVCSARGSNLEYKVSDPEWEARPEGEWKQFTSEQKRATTGDGYFRVRVTNLKRAVSANPLLLKLGDIYRPLIMDGSVRIIVNNRDLAPIQINYVEDDPNLQPSTQKIQTRLGEWVTIKIGILQEGQTLEPGIRCYYKGRKIEDGQFFGHKSPSQLPQMSRLIGEAHLDFVPVTTNKNSFDKGSVEYEDVARRLHTALGPWVEKLEKMRFEQRAPVENFEKELAKSAKRALEHIFASTGLITKADLEGESTGRRPGVRTGLPPAPPTGKPGGPGPKEGQTAPTIDATIGEMKRWGALYEWDVRPAGSSGKRADVIQTNGRNILIINSDYSLYQAAKRAGDPALEVYMAETAIMKICEMVTRNNSLEDYMRLTEIYNRECGDFYKSRIRVPGESRRSRGTIRFQSQK